MDITETNGETNYNAMLPFYGIEGINPAKE
jgi:hypothetical protein